MLWLPRVQVSESAKWIVSCSRRLNESFGPPNDQVMPRSTKCGRRVVAADESKSSAGFVMPNCALVMAAMSSVCSRVLRSVK